MKGSRPIQAALSRDTDMSKTRHTTDVHATLLKHVKPDISMPTLVISKHCHPSSHKS